MRIDKPAWVRHPGDKAIYTVDVSPCGRRFATGGPNDARIWSLASTGPVAPKALLATLTAHLQDIYTVRFHPQGRFLATGAADKLAMIWERQEGAAAAGGGGGSGAFGSDNQENWQRVMTLNGHESDIVDMSWAPDGSMLATCGLDSCCLIWRLPARRGHQFVQPLARCVHSTVVKGVAWDPVGAYVACSSEDGCVSLWRHVKDDDGRGERFTCESRSTESFRDCRLQTYFRRLSWAPDGIFLSCTNAVKDNKYVCALLGREELQVKGLLVGNSSAVVATRWSPRLYHPSAGAEQKDAPRAGAGAYGLLCAVGGADKCVNVWFNGSPTPVFVLRNAFEDSVSDVAWAPDGRTLLASSLDGTCAVLSLSEEELPRLMAPSAAREKVISLHNVDPSNLSGVHVAENLAQISLERSAPPKAAPRAAPRPEAAPSPLRRRVMQKETLTKTGKRRITPMTVTSAPSSAANAPSSAANAPSHRAVAPSRRANAPPSPPPRAPRPPGPSPPGAKRARLAGGGALRVPRVDSLSFSAEKMPLKLSRHLYTEEGSGAAVVASFAPLEGAAEAMTAVSAQRVGEEAPLWRSVVAGRAVCMDGCRRAVAVGTSDGALHLLENAGGSRALAPLVLGASVAAVAWDGAGGRLCAIAADGAFRVWTMDASGAIGCECSASAAPLLRSIGGSCSVVRLALRRAGAPVLVLRGSSGQDPAGAQGHTQAFSYSTAAACWVRVADHRFRQSDFASPRVARALCGSLSALQSEALRGERAPPASASDAVVQQRLTEAHVEDRLSCAVAVGAADDFRGWAAVYGRLLARPGREEKLRRVCDLLVNAEGKREKAVGDAWWGERAGEAMGADPKDVLRDILREAAANRALQSFVQEYAEIAGLAQDADGPEAP